MKRLTLILIGAGIGAAALWLLFGEQIAATVAQVRAERDANPSDKLPALEKLSVVIEKNKRELRVYDADKLIKTYRVALGFAPTGDKAKQGDGRTPEGVYRIAVKNPQSRFYLSLGLNYPNAADARQGLRDKLISQAEHDAIVEADKNNKLPAQNTALGGEIYIHGGGVEDDWTWGCAALRDEEIKELFDALPLGTPILIEP